MKKQTPKLSRRNFFKKSASLSIGTLLAGGMSKSTASNWSDIFDFLSVPANTVDTVTVPEGYSWDRLISYGDTLWDEPSKPDKTPVSNLKLSRSFGDSNDGMEIFKFGEREILVVNNEWFNPAEGEKSKRSEYTIPLEIVNKGRQSVGVSIVEIGRKNGNYVTLKNSMYNRRITANTPMDLTGPGAGHLLLQTADDRLGLTSLGTWTNCGSGKTPWGTFLSCEEGLPYFFGTDQEDFKPLPTQKRYGLGNPNNRFQCHRADERFDLYKHPNECNRYGYVVEIDPLAPNTNPKKRTALGRFRHENAEVVIGKSGQIVVYMGDDAQGEFIYKYVSSAIYSKDTPPDNLLDEGTLFVAKFHSDKRGQWLPLTPETTGLKEAAEVCVHTRVAGSAVKATPMDRPEWICARPGTSEVYCSLTNNVRRGLGRNLAGEKMVLDGPNPRTGNKYGQILRLKAKNNDHCSDEFDWDLYLVAGNPLVHEDEYRGSTNIKVSNMFNGPDGLRFDSQDRLWIQTDGDTSNSGEFLGQGNNQMLVGNPNTGEIRRFLTGPRGCEITGLCWNEDRTAMFVGIQHPGENSPSEFPDGKGYAPRSSVIVVTHNDGNEIG